MHLLITLIKVRITLLTTSLKILIVSLGALGYNWCNGLCTSYAVQDVCYEFLQGIGLGFFTGSEGMADCQPSSLRILVGDQLGGLQAWG